MNKKALRLSGDGFSLAIGKGFPTSSSFSPPDIGAMVCGKSPFETG
jgi:hypothetical protein